MIIFFRAAMQRPIPLNSSRIALVVGLILNIINQGDNLWLGENISWGHIVMNFIVPYCVATYSAVKIAREGDKNAC